jgi:hypothetical protein
MPTGYSLGALQLSFERAVSAVAKGRLDGGLELLPGESGLALESQSRIVAG